MIYKLGVENIEKAKKQSASNNIDFFIGRMDFLASGKNENGFTITNDALKECASTVLGKFVTFKYSYLEKDVMSHETDLQICGYIPPNAEIRFAEIEDGNLMASVDCVLSKIYCLEIYDLFKDDNYRPVSVEFSTVESEDDIVSAFNIHSVTLLGKNVEPAIDNANIQIIKFSKDKANEFYQNLKDEKREIKINEKKLLTDEWNTIDKTVLRNKVLNAKNVDVLVHKVYALVLDNWEKAPSENLKYPIMQIKDNVAYYNINALESALKFAKGQNETEVVEKVEKILNKFNDNRKEKIMENEVVMKFLADTLSKFVDEKKLEDEEFAKEIKGCSVEQLADKVINAKACEDELLAKVKGLEEELAEKSKACEELAKEKVAKELSDFMGDLKGKLSDDTYTELSEKAKDIYTEEQFEEFSKDAKIKAYEDMAKVLADSKIDAFKDIQKVLSEFDGSEGIEDDGEASKIVKCSKVETKGKEVNSIWDRL